MLSRRFSVALIAVLAAVGFAVMPISQKIERRNAIRVVENVQLPPPTEEIPVSSSSRASLRSEVNWSVPFTSQAPNGEWDALHEEACEEASVAMVLRYFDGETFASPIDADRQITALVAMNETTLGFGVSQSVQEVASLIAKNARNLRISVVSDPTEDSLMSALSAGSLVIIPAAGRELYNPYFRSPGPLYHMLVLRGYTSDGYVITNDPGTKHGEQFVYRWDILMDAIHDWNDGDVLAGKKAVIIVGKYTPGKRT